MSVINLQLIDEHYFWMHLVIFKNHIYVQSFQKQINAKNLRTRVIQCTLIASYGENDGGTKWFASLFVWVDVRSRSVWRKRNKTIERLKVSGLLEKKTRSYCQI